MERLNFPDDCICVGERKELAEYKLNRFITATNETTITEE